jgi:hypothetical protein
LQEILVEVGEFIDEIWVNLKDNVEISNPLEDKGIEDINKLFEMVNLASIGPLRVAALEVVEVQHSAVLKGVTSDTLTCGQAELA